MRVLIAGASGAIGRPLVRCLREQHHVVFGMGRSFDSARTLTEIGAEPVTGDALDRTSVSAAIERVRPDAIINELTSLPRHYTPEEMKAAGERDRKIRIEGNANLLDAIRGSGVRRYILQSSGFWYAPGAGLADESALLISTNAPPGVEGSARTYVELETRASAVAGIAFVALRYGFFYGPGTWFTCDGDMGEQVRRQQVPVIGEGEGVSSFVHIDDAAEATAAALHCAPGAYNIVDGNPSPQRVWLPAFARAVGAPPPPHLTGEQASTQTGSDSVYYATRLRGASNEKARRLLNFNPRRLEWL
jgi:2-alkyl-3-oxoalkanoate reductase